MQRVIGRTHQRPPDSDRFVSHLEYLEHQAAAGLLGRSGRQPFRAILLSVELYFKFRLSPVLSPCCSSVSVLLTSEVLTRSCVIPSPSLLPGSSSVVVSTVTVSRSQVVLPVSQVSYALATLLLQNRFPPTPP
jgi:hypothetical protein